jgi:hypothetical protein
MRLDKRIEIQWNCSKWFSKSTFGTKNIKTSGVALCSGFSGIDCIKKKLNISVFQ